MMYTLYYKYIIISITINKNIPEYFIDVTIDF